MLRVLHITNCYPNKKNPIFGIFIKEQIESLKQNGVYCDVFYINARYKNKLEYFKAIPKIKKLAKNFDIIHAHHPYSAFITSFLARVKKPIIVTFLSVPTAETDKFIFLSKLVRVMLLKNLKYFIVKFDPTIEGKYPGRGYYVPNGVDLNFFKEINREEAWRRLSIEPGKYLLFCSSGSLHRKVKRYDIFKKTLQILNGKYRENIREFTLVGVNRELVPYYFNAASVHLLTSDYEGSPNSVKEALACNVPVVSTDVGSVKEVIGDVKGCYASKSNDPEKLAQFVMKALQYDRVKGRDALIRKGLDMNSVALRIISIYRKILHQD